MKKIAFVSLMTMIIFAFLTLLPNELRIIHAQEPLTLSVIFDNGLSNATEYVGDDFTVSIEISNAPLFDFWDMQIQWDPTVLELKTGTREDVHEGNFMKAFGITVFVVVQEPNNTAGLLPEICCGFAGGGPAYGSGILLTIDFHCKAMGQSSIIIMDPYLFYGVYGVPIDAVNNGLVEIIPEFPFNDVAIHGITLSSDCVCAGENVSINADIWNVGDFTETFDVTTYADLNSTITVLIGTQSLSLLPKDSATVIFAWNTTGVFQGNYTISVFANITEDACLQDNIAYSKIEIFDSPFADINITGLDTLTINPLLFAFDPNYHARIVNIGNATIRSVGYEGNLAIIGSRNGTIRLCVSQPNVNGWSFYLPLNGSVQVPLWLMFQPETHWETYNGDFTLQLTCGGHKPRLKIIGISIDVCQNGAYTVRNETAIFTWNLTGGSWVYLEAETNLPPGWFCTVDPPVGTLFETPHLITVHIAAPPDAGEGDIGSVTLRAYKNATHAMIWQFIYFASTDNKPPTVEAIQPTLTFNGDLQFNATLKDKSGIASVQFYYSVNNGPWSNQTMQWASGDTFNSTLYKSIIPHVPNNSVVRYHVVAKDWFKNQTQTNDQTITVTYDLSIAQAKISKTVMGKGLPIQINVTIANEGTIPSTSLRVAIYANTTLVGKKKLLLVQTVPFLANGTEATLEFLWNALNLPKNKTYEITAYAIPILSEAYTANNFYTAGQILITPVGDLGSKVGMDIEFFKCDGNVDGKDLALFLLCFKNQAQPEAMYLGDLGRKVDLPPPPHVVFFDVDGKCDGSDLALFLLCYKGYDPNS